MQEERFHVMPSPMAADDPEECRNVVGWFAVVDEESGGIVAYFGSENDACRYVDFLRKETPCNTESNSP